LFLFHVSGIPPGLRPTKLASNFPPSANSQIIPTFIIITMKAVTVRELKEELNLRTPKDVRELCLRLARFKKENKELLTYLLFEAADEALYIESVKAEIDQQFDEVNRKSYYLFKKSVTKILRITRKYIRYSLNKQTEVELLIYFCRKLKKVSPSINKNAGLLKLYHRQIEIILKKISELHEDLQLDYESEMGVLTR
jgi:hypothetical protein